MDENPAPAAERPTAAPPLPRSAPEPLSGLAPPAGPAGDRSLTLQTLLGPLVVPDGAGRATELEELSRRAAIYATRARGDGTRRTYRSAWRHYEAWCRSLGRDPLAGDPDTIAMYVVRRADDGLAVSSIRVALAAIRTAHLLAGIALDLRHPALAMVLEGVVRSKGSRPSRQAAPAVPDLLRRLLAPFAGIPPAAAGGTLASSALPSPDTPLRARSRAMLLLGFGAALRRSELVALAFGDVQPVPGRGLRILVRRSKTDPHGKGQEIAVWGNPADPGFCVVHALDAWLTHRYAAPDFCPGADLASRPLFCALTKKGRLTGAALSDKAVARLVKQAAAAAGLDAEKFSGHSLRAGLATAAGDAGAGLAELMRQTRHRSTEGALGYLRPADLWRNNVTERVFRADDRDAK